MADLKRGKKLQFCRGYYLFDRGSNWFFYKKYPKYYLTDPDSRLLQQIAGPQI